MFAYCLNNPVNGSDPCGTCFHRWDCWNDCNECKSKSLWQKVSDVGNLIYENQQAMAQEQQYQAQLQVQAMRQTYDACKRFLDENEWVQDGIAVYKFASGLKRLGNAGALLTAPVPSVVKGVGLLLWGMWSIATALEEFSD